VEGRPAGSLVDSFELGPRRRDPEEPLAHRLELDPCTVAVQAALDSDAARAG